MTRRSLLEGIAFFAILILALCAESIADLIFTLF